MKTRDASSSATGPIFPNVHVPLSGQDGNVFAIMGRVETALKKAGVPREKIQQFCGEVEASDDYDGALRTVMRWVRTS